MDYFKIYNSLIERGKDRILESYTEKHHIIPRCMNGTDEEENLVRLTPEEHYLAHQLLVKIYPDNKSLVYAAVMMIPNRPSNKLYGWLKRSHAEHKSAEQSGPGNSNYGTKWVYNANTGDSKKIKSNDDMPLGYELGRRINSKVPKFTDLQTCKSCKTEIRRATAYYWHNEFKKSNCKSLRDFVLKSKYDKSHVSLIKMFKKYVTDFKPVQGRNFIG